MITHDMNKTGTKSCCVIARTCIKHGYHPQEHIEFIRGTTPVFKAAPLRWWADREVRESEGGRHMKFAKLPETSSEKADFRGGYAPEFASGGSSVSTHLKVA